MLSIRTRWTSKHDVDDLLLQLTKNEKKGKTPFSHFHKGKKPIFGLRPKFNCKLTDESPNMSSILFIIHIKKNFIQIHWRVLCTKSQCCNFLYTFRLRHIKILIRVCGTRVFCLWGETSLCLYTVYRIFYTLHVPF